MTTTMTARRTRSRTRTMSVTSWAMTETIIKKLSVRKRTKTFCNIEHILILIYYKTNSSEKTVLFQALKFKLKGRMHFNLSKGTYKILYGLNCEQGHCVRIARN